MKAGFSVAIPMGINVVPRIQKYARAFFFLLMPVFHQEIPFVPRKSDLVITLTIRLGLLQAEVASNKPNFAQSPTILDFSITGRNTERL